MLSSSDFMWLSVLPLDFPVAQKAIFKASKAKVEEAGVRQDFSTTLGASTGARADPADPTTVDEAGYSHDLLTAQRPHKP